MCNSQHSSLLHALLTWTWAACSSCGSQSPWQAGTGECPPSGWCSTNHQAPNWLSLICLASRQGGTISAPVAYIVSCVVLCIPPALYVLGLDPGEMRFLQQCHQLPCPRCNPQPDVPMCQWPSTRSHAFFLQSKQLKRTGIWIKWTYQMALNSLPTWGAHSCYHLFPFFIFLSWPYDNSIKLSQFFIKKQEQQKT